MNPSGSSEDNLFFFANVMYDIQRPKDGIEMMGKLAKIKPTFGLRERITLETIFKAAVNNIRNSLEVLLDHLQRYEDDENEPSRKDFYQPIQGIYEETFNDLKSLCDQVLSIVNTYLLPNAETSQAKVFYYKLQGDIYRYISEFADGKEKDAALANADKSYSLAMPIAQSELKKSDPVHLGLILNYSVLKYEHMHEIQEAERIVNQAVQSWGEDSNDLTPDAIDEAKSIIVVMQKNLNLWERNANIKNESDNGEEES